MKQPLIILAISITSCTQKQQEQPMGASIDPTINTRIMALANAVIKQSGKDSIQDKQILSLQNTNVILQKAHIKDSLQLSILKDSFNISDTFIGGKGIKLTMLSYHKFQIEVTP